MRMLNARASRSLPLVLLVIPAVVVALYVAWSGLHWTVLAAVPARFVMMVLLVVSAWLPLVYVISRRSTTLGPDAEGEATLARERTMLRTLIDNLPYFIYVKDRESRLLLVNLAAARVLGVEDPEQVLGKSDFDLHSHEQALRSSSRDQEVMCSGKALINI